MTSLKNKIVFITGASSGIGKACAEAFAEAGARLILTARRIEMLEEFAKNLKQQHGTEVLALPLDVRHAEQVKKAIQALPETFNQIDILINNAGLALTSDMAQHANPDNWDVMIDTNIKGLLYVTHAILPNLISRNAGHIINIGSISGHEVYPGGNVYCATKHAVNAISKALRMDLLGTHIRVTEIDPGIVKTEFSEVRWKDKQKADEYYGTMDPLLPEDIADAVIYCASRRASVNIAELLILPTCQASVSHIARTEPA